MKNIRVEDELYTKLERLAKRERRTNQKQLEYMLDHSLQSIDHVPRTPADIPAREFAQKPWDKASHDGLAKHSAAHAPINQSDNRSEKA